MTFRVLVLCFPYLSRRFDKITSSFLFSVAHVNNAIFFREIRQRREHSSRFFVTRELTLVP